MVTGIWYLYVLLLFLMIAWQTFRAIAKPKPDRILPVGFTLTFLVITLAMITVMALEPPFTKRAQSDVGVGAGLSCIFALFTPFIPYLMTFCSTNTTPASNKGKDASVTGWAVGPRGVRLHKGPAGKFNSWWYLHFGLESFVRGFWIKEISIKDTSGETIEILCSAHATTSTPYLTRHQVWEAALDGLKQAVLSTKGDEQIGSVANEYKPDNLDFKIEKLTIFPVPPLPPPPRVIIPCPR